MTGPSRGEGWTLPSSSALPSVLNYLLLKIVFKLQILSWHLLKIGRIHFFELLLLKRVLKILDKRLDVKPPSLQRIHSVADNVICPGWMKTRHPALSAASDNIDCRYRYMYIYIYITYFFNAACVCSTYWVQLLSGSQQMQPCCSSLGGCVRVNSVWFIRCRASAPCCQSWNAAGFGGVLGGMGNAGVLNRSSCFVVSCEWQLPAVGAVRGWVAWAQSPGRGQPGGSLWMTGAETGHNSAVLAHHGVTAACLFRWGSQVAAGGARTAGGAAAACSCAAARGRLQSPLAPRPWGCVSPPRPVGVCLSLLLRLGPYRPETSITRHHEAA